VQNRTVGLPASVQVCTLNEAGNIQACLERIIANDPEDVVVIDGGSSDRTLAIARGLGVRTIEAGPIGLARQRQLGYSSSPHAYTAFVDADDRLPHTWLATMIEELEAGGYSALQGCLRVLDPSDFWTHGWDSYLQATIQPAADTIIVGRPALFRTEALLGIAHEPGMIIEDTEMSRDFELRGLRQGIGTSISFRICPSGAAENARKWRGYGKGYRQFVTAHPERRQAILKHMLWTVPVRRSIPALGQGRVRQPAFGAVMSANMLIGWLSPDSR
jgi:glycosyltransferase involved in cell wall biosynthesis